ncbi:hypothetical protein P4H67_12165 [Paenibacillus lautus]|uniref:hypothetical protein n=1 Tax=Paenibacillus lautus TaxID=1401 RepID=UPI002DB9CB62|nr:hypothetical protein [Paenibacillus lautus]MEC0307504.1 hypothetical protein [Paenibacillus lautus]
MSSKTTNIGASGGVIFVGEASFKSDSKYVEMSVAGGAGVSAQVMLIPIDGSLEKEYFVEFDVPFNLGKEAQLYPHYVGAPNAEEWINMWNGNGW